MNCNGCPQALACVKGRARHSSCVYPKYTPTKYDIIHTVIIIYFASTDRRALPFASQRVTECPCALAFRTMPECSPLPSIHVNLHTYNKQQSSKL